MNEQGTNARATGSAPGYWTYPLERKAAEEHYPGRPKGRKGIKTVKKAGNGYLNTIIKPIPITQTEPLFSEDNYMYLYESAKNYAKLLGKEFSLEADPDNFTGLYRKLRDILPEGHQLDLSAEDKDLYFIVTDDRAYTSFYSDVSILTIYCDSQADRGFTIL